MLRGAVGPLAETARPVGLAAATTYVATDGDDGTGDGSLGKSWVTITHVLDQVPDEGAPAPTAARALAP